VTLCLRISFFFFCFCCCFCFFLSSFFYFYLFLIFIKNFFSILQSQSSSSGLPPSSISSSSRAPWLSPAPTSAGARSRSSALISLFRLLLGGGGVDRSIVRSFD